jgi:hypothetical protein
LEEAMSNPEHSKLFSRYAIALFVVGLVGYVPLAAFAPFHFAAAFLVIAELLALVLGIHGWRHTPAKVAVIGVLVVALWSGIAYAMFLQAGQRSEVRMITDFSKLDSR